MSLSGVVGRAPAPTELDDLAPSCLSFYGVRIDLGGQSLFSDGVYEEGGEGVHPARYAGKWHLTVGLGSFP